MMSVRKSPCQTITNTHTHTHTHTHPRVKSENNDSMDYQQRCFRESQNFHLFRVALIPQPVHHLRYERCPLAGLAYDVGRVEQPLVQRTRQLDYFLLFSYSYHFYYRRPYSNLVQQSCLAERSASIDPGGRQAVARCLDTNSQQSVP